MHHPNRATLVVLAVSACLAEAGELRLKTRTIATAAEESVGVSTSLFSVSESVGRRMTPARAHYLISIEGDATATLAELVLRGGRVLAQVPETGYIVAAPEGMRWEGLEFSYRNWIEARDKLSPALEEMQLAAGELSGEESSPAAGRHLLIVRFHKDVEAWQADGVLADEGVMVRANASLEAMDRLVEATEEEARRLARWDEVEYVFPAPAGMREGELYWACGGVHTGEVEVSMLAAVYGAGWDGPGRGRADLTFSFGAMPAGLAAESVRGEVRRALAEWSRVVAVNFRETTARTAARNVDILFASGEHGDPFPFLPGSTTLGHAFYPSPPNAEPLAGDIHVNTAYTWTVGGTWDIYSLILHETGHSLGIGHTDVPGSVMYPYYQRASGLKPEDIASIRQLYADAGGTAAALSLAFTAPAEGARTSAGTLSLTGTLSNAGTGVVVDYLNEATGARGPCFVSANASGWTCSGVPLRAGENAVSVRAVSNGQTAQARRVFVREAEADVVLTISSPLAGSSGRVNTTAATLLVQGTAQHSTGVASVRWSGANGQSGTAALTAANQPTTQWSATLPLGMGINEISVRALARNGMSATRSRTVERSAPAPAPPTNPSTDRTAPQMTVQAPIGTFIFTSAPRMTFRGTATDNIGIARVSWRNSAGGQAGEANLAATPAGVQWTFDVNLLAGFNNIEIRAWDAAGNASGYTATVRRY